MDGTTEPIVVVIGHPIAGNPTQLALERALAQMRLEFRVLSFDVLPQNIAKALDGFDVTGVAGVMVDPTVRREASSWNHQRDSGALTPEPSEVSVVEPGEDAAKAGVHSPPVDAEPEADELPKVIDCLSRDELGNFVSSFERLEAIKLILEDIQSRSGVPSSRLWVGDFRHSSQWAQGIVSDAALEAHVVSGPPDPEAILTANLILLSDSDPSLSAENLEIDQWPASDGNTTVIDLGVHHEEMSLIEAIGYRVVTDRQIQVATLQQCLRCWTGKIAPAETMDEAIEEYLGV